MVGRGVEDLARGRECAVEVARGDLQHAQVIEPVRVERLCVLIRRERHGQEERRLVHVARRSLLHDAIEQSVRLLAR